MCIYQYVAYRASELMELGKLGKGQKLTCIIHSVCATVKIGFGHTRLVNTDNFYDSMVSFPFQQTLSDEDLTYMISSIKKYFKQN